MQVALPMLPTVRPISDLRTNLNDVCDLARESQEPIFMTKNGAPALVVMDSQAYENQRLHDRFVLKVREAEIEAKYNKSSASQEELDAKLNGIFAQWGLEPC